MKPCEVDPPSLDKVFTAARHLRKNRTSGEVGIPEDIDKVRLDPKARFLHRAFSKVWLCEAARHNWGETILLPLFKKGDKWGDSMPDVRRGCALSPTPFNYVVDWILGHTLHDYSGV